MLEQFETNARFKETKNFWQNRFITSYAIYLCVSGFQLNRNVTFYCFCFAFLFIFILIYAFIYFYSFVFASSVINSNLFPFLKIIIITCLSKDEHYIKKRELSLISLSGIEVWRKDPVYHYEISIL